jgi:hypothetical protein
MDMADQEVELGETVRVEGNVIGGSEKMEDGMGYGRWMLIQRMWVVSDVVTRQFGRGIVGYLPKMAVSVVMRHP